MFDIKRKSIEWGGRKLTLETGRMARQADGAVLATYGETMVLATAVYAKSANDDADSVVVCVVLVARPTRVNPYDDAHHVRG